MKKGIRIALISLASLIGLILVAALVACWLIFTPSRLTAVVNRFSDKFITCENHFERVDLSLFRTFPDAGLDVRNVVFINPMDGVGDTLATVGRLTLAVDVRQFLKHRDIKVRQLCLDKLSANIFVDSLGNANYDIFASSDTEDTSASEPFSLPGTIELKKVSVNDFSATYADLSASTFAAFDKVDLALKGSWIDSLADLSLNFAAPTLSLRALDSAGNASIDTRLANLELEVDAQGGLDCLDGNLLLTVPKADVSLAGEQYATFETAGKHKLLRIKMPYRANLDSLAVQLKESTLSLAQFDLNLDGTVQLPLSADSLSGAPSRDMGVDLAFDAKKWDVEAILEILPPSLKTWSKGMHIESDLSFSGTARGSVGDSVMPLVDAQVTLSDGKFVDHDLLPYDFKKIAAHLDAHLDISSAHPEPSTVKINSFSAATGSNKVTLSGKINDLLGRFLADVRIGGHVALPDVKPLLPDDLDLDAKGTATLDIHAKADLEQIQAVDVKNMFVDGKIDFNHLDVRLDSIYAQSPKLSIDVNVTPGKMKRIDHQMLDAKITGGSLHATVLQASIDADLTNVDLDAAISDVIDTTVPFAVACNFNMGRILASIDSMQASVVEPKGTFRMQPNVKNPDKVRYDVDYNSESLYFKLNDTMSLNMAGLTIKGKSDYDPKRGNLLQQWSPDLDVDFKNGYVDMAQLMYMLQIPSIKFNYKPEKCEIASANLAFGNSDYYLSGSVTGLEKWISHEDMLRGDLYFTSNFTNVDDLLASFSGMGSDPDTLEAQRKEDNVAKEANPFIVPKDVDFTLHTRIKEAVAFENELQELAGDVTVRDGVAVLDQIGFVCKAARMQLTALYKTPRVNHIFAGLDFHLLDINVDELIDMIPYVDTLVPLLSAFDGNADFHLCAETYLNAFYQPKMSTLRGAADINGKNLTVLDNEKISTLAKLLKMKEWKQDDNKLVFDSLDIAMTVFRKNVEVYPFLLSLNKYQLVASGRHSLDNTLDYHVEIVQSPIPGRLAVDVLSLDPFKLTLSPVRYAELYRPEKRNDTQEQTLRLKQMIRESLEANVHEETRRYTGLDAVPDNQ